MKKVSLIFSETSRESDASQRAFMRCLTNNPTEDARHPMNGEKEKEAGYHLPTTDKNIKISILINASRKRKPIKLKNTQEKLEGINKDHGNWGRRQWQRRQDNEYFVLSRWQFRSSSRLRIDLQMDTHVLGNFGFNDEKIFGSNEGAPRYKLAL